MDAAMLPVPAQVPERQAVIGGILTSTVIYLMAGGR